MRAFYIVIVITLLPFAALAQLQPAEGRLLNYRIIRFSFPAEHGATTYTLEIAPGNYYNVDSFKNNIRVSATSTRNDVIAEVPSFDCAYTWRVASVSNEKKSGPLHHFTTGTAPGTDTSLVRMTITANALKYKDAFVFVDETKVLYDMKGNPVWYLPVAEDTDNSNRVRDLKMSVGKTITYEIDKGGAYEVDYNGTLLWRAPDDGSVSGLKREGYHHEFTKLQNGHYMAMGEEIAFCNSPSPTDTSLRIVQRSNIKNGANNYQRLPMGTLIEYDKTGKVIWSWKASKALNGSSVLYRNINGKGIFVPPHENAFFFDEQNKVIYICCRDINSIIKLQYPQGNIISIYNGAQDNSSLFCGQHSCKLSHDGSLYLYNNNNCTPGGGPSLAILKQPGSDMHLPEKVWEYQCPTDSIYRNRDFPSGGNIIELPDNSLFVSMAYPASNVFIVNRDKEVLWNAVLEKWSNDENKWAPQKIYRANMIVSRKALEQLIRNAQ